jgi:hypothetical protein
MNMAFTSVSGTVTRTFHNGRGAEITESFTVKDKEIKKRWTAWFEQEHGLSEGDVVEVSGMHGDEVDEWLDKEQQKRHSVKRSLNKAKIKGSAAPAAPSAPQQSDGDVWNAPGSFNDETPF